MKRIQNSYIRANWNKHVYSQLKHRKVLGHIKLNFNMNELLLSYIKLHNKIKYHKNTDVQLMESLTI